MIKLNELFGTLTVPAQGDAPDLRFDTLEIPGSTGFYLGRSARNHAALLVDITSKYEHVPPPVRLESLSVYHDATCRVSQAATVRTRNYSVVVATTDSETTRRYFLELLPALIGSLGVNPKPIEITRALSALVELFRAASRPARTTVQGMWSELFILAHAEDPELLVRAWHSDPQDRYDFHAGVQRLEVKSATAVRRHHVSHDQVSPPGGTRVAIASVLTTRASSTSSIRALLARVLSSVARHADLQLRVHEIVASSLGSALESSLDEGFDEELAEESVRFFDALGLPSLPGPIPPEVSEVRYVIDFSNAVPMLAAELTSSGGLFGACAVLVR